MPARGGGSPKTIAGLRLAASRSRAGDALKRRMSRGEPKGQTGKTFRAFRDAGINPREAFRRATGRSAESVFNSRGKRGRR